VGSVRCRQVAVLAVALCGLWPAAAQAAPGDLDPSFGIGGKLTTDFGGGEDGAGDMALQPDSKLVVAGRDGDNNEFVLARYDVSGALDTSFGGGDGVATSDLPDYGALALMPDGSIMVADGDGDFILARFTSAGGLDTTFGGGDGIVQADLGGNDYAYDIVRQSDGKLLLCGQGGTADDFALVRLNADGTLDTSFGGGDGTVTTQFGEDLFGYEDVASALAVMPDGKIVAAGGTGIDGTPTNESNFAVARYQPDGSLDTGFAGDGTATLDFGGFDSASAIVVQPNGKVVVGGTGVLAGKAHVTLVRYLTSGSLDPGFGGGDGIVTNDLGPFGSGVSDLVLQADGRIVAGGSGGDSAEDFLIVRYNPSGSLDTTFGDGDGWATADFKDDSDWANALALQPDGKIVAVGQARNLGTFDDEFALARFEGGGTPPTEEEEPGQPPGEAPSQPLPPSGPSASPPSSATVQPGDSARLGLATAAGTAQVKGGAALVRLRCDGQAACRGVAKLQARVPSKRSARRSAAKSVVLGQSRFRVPAGKARLLRILLNREGQQLVRRAGRRGLRVRLTGRGLRNRAVWLKPTRTRHGGRTER
jgi:uncharacterized delta-60 repeat protein